MRRASAMRGGSSFVNWRRSKLNNAKRMKTKIQTTENCSRRKYLQIWGCAVALTIYKTTCASLRRKTAAPVWY